MIYETQNNELISLRDMQKILHGSIEDKPCIVVVWSADEAEQIYTTDEGWKAQIAYEYIRDAYKLGVTLISHAEIEEQVEQAKGTVYAMTSTSTQGIA